MNPFANLTAPSLDDFEAIARQAFAALPHSFRQMAGDIVIRIEDFAAEAVLQDMQIEDPFELTGLYTGVDLPTRSVMDPVGSIPMVFLFRRPILDEWADRAEVTLYELIEHVLVHEIGHHFGLSDDEMDTLLTGGDD
jgi:predicted Zn-dependent protease with MMP-like domain